VAWCSHGHQSPLIGLPNSATALRCKIATSRLSSFPRQLDSKLRNCLAFRFVAFRSPRSISRPQMLPPFRRSFPFFDDRRALSPGGESGRRGVVTFGHRPDHYEALGRPLTGRLQGSAQKAASGFPSRPSPSAAETSIGLVSRNHLRGPGFRGG
jgi:hypothetical protein